MSSCPTSMPDFQVADLVTVALLVTLEGLLSADNAMVLAVLVLGLPKKEQKQALRYGILGAFVFRALATILAAYLINLAWVKIARFRLSPVPGLPALLGRPERRRSPDAPEGAAVARA